MTLMTPPPLDQQQQQQPQQEDDEMLVPHTEFPHGPQPMEVSQAETANTVDAQPVDDPPSARFTWTIDNFSRLNIKKLYSDVFYVGGYKWRILIFPKGNNVDHLSMYLDVADLATLPYAWSRYAQFSLSVINQVQSKYSVRKETQHQFNARESDWGFTTFMPLGELYDPAKGYLVNDTCIVEADVAVLSYEGQQGKQELKRKEECFYTVLKVARNEDLTEQIGRDIYFDLVNHDKVRHFRIPKQMPFYQFKEKVANEFGIPVQFQRFWMWAKRQNHTYRPLRPLTSLEELQPVGQLREISDKKNKKDLKLFLEVELDSDLQSIALPEKTKEDILLFCKLYDPQKEVLRYVGRLFAKLSGKPNGILTKLNQMAGFSPNQEIELFEEIKFEPCVMCEPIAKEVTFRASQIEDGDIICFQKSQAGIEQCRYPDVPSFLENLSKRKGAYVKAQQDPEHTESQTIILDAPHVTKLPPSPGSLSQGQSTQVAVDLTVIGEQSEQVNLFAKSNVFPQAVTHTTFLTESSEQNEQDAHEAKTTPFLSASLPTDPTSVHPRQEPNLVEAAIDSSSFASFDALFADIQSLLEVKTFEADSWSIDEIAVAKKIVKKCLDMKLASFIQSGRSSEFKKSVSALLTVNAFPDSMVDMITKFLDDFDQSCERYVGAEQDLREVEQKENSIVELKTSLKQLSSKFMPARNRADEVNQEIADLERQLAERKAEKAQLQSNLEELAVNATMSRQALINAEQDMTLFRHKKEEAEKTVDEIEISWESMKDYCFLILL